MAITQHAGAPSPIKVHFYLLIQPTWWTSLAFLLFLAPGLSCKTSTTSWVGEWRSSMRRRSRRVFPGEMSRFSSSKLCRLFAVAVVVVLLCSCFVSDVAIGFISNFWASARGPLCWTWIGCCCCCCRSCCCCCGHMFCNKLDKIGTFCFRHFWVWTIRIKIGNSVTRVGDFLHLGQLFKAFCNN